MSKSQKEQKFNSIYSEWVQALFRFIYYKTKNESLAEDIVQEAFIKFWDKMDTIDSGKEKSYLYTSAKNILLNKLAHDKVVKLHSKVIEVDSVKSPQYDLEYSEYQKKLQEAIDGLPENQRVVFLMNRIDGYKYREIAEILGLSQKAVEKRMSLALKALRNLNHKV